MARHDANFRTSQRAWTTRGSVRTVRELSKSREMKDRSVFNQLIIQLVSVVPVRPSHEVYIPTHNATLEE